MTEPDPTTAEPVGSVAEEAFKLFRALSSTSQDDTASPDDPGSAHVCTTTWCPVCQVVGFVRDNPETVTQLSESATAFAKSLRDLLDVALSPREES